MYRIRFHGRGGQGMKTASRILGSALFAEGFEVQDSPRYGAERRGAPLYATVRAGPEPIRERGPILHPDLVVVADDTLVSSAAGAGILGGMTPRSVLLLQTLESAETWRERLRLASPVLVVAPGPAEAGEPHFPGALCTGAAARLLGVLSLEALEGAVREELADMPDDVREANLAAARNGWGSMEQHEGCVQQAKQDSPADSPSPAWIELPFEAAGVSAPAVHGAVTSVQVRTGLWRTLRPVLARERCSRCHWLCGTQCPDSAISPDADGYPVIDYDHCKGCLVCVAVCPRHAIDSIPEARARAEEVER